MAVRPVSRVVLLSSKLEKMLGGEHIYLLVLAAIVGLLGGLGAVTFRELIGLVRSYSFPKGASLEALAAIPWYFKVLPPTIGGMLVGPLVWFLAREAKGHGIPEVMNAVSNRGGRIRRRVMAVKTLASALTIGTGGSVGREGPIVQIGAGLGSSIGQWLGFEGNRLIVLLGCGAAAGMAATFNAPIAGVILAVELIIGTASISIFSPLVVASVMGTITARLLYGDEPAFVNVPEYTLVSVIELPLYVLLGVLAGIAALSFIKGICWLEEFWENLPIPGWLAPAIGGLVIGLLSLLFPEVLGVGYETIEVALHGTGTLWILAALVGVKILASGMTLGSGGSGGVFAPSLFVGACLGGAFGMILEKVLPGQTAHSGAYALVGMGAVLAGTTHAPITAIIMLFELTSNYTIILPLMLSCIISVVISSKIQPTSIFTTRLLRKGIRLRGSSEAELMRATKVRRILRPFPETMPPCTPFDDIIRRALRGSLSHQYIVDDENRPLGVITLRRIKSLLSEQDLEPRLIVAADVMKSPLLAMGLDDTLADAMSHLSRLDVEMLPVIDEDGRLAGAITRHDMMVFFEHEILKDDHQSLKFVAAGRPEEAQFIEVPEGHIVDTVEVTPSIAGMTLRQLDLRATTDLNVIGIRRHDAEGVERIQPDPGRPLGLGEFLILVGPQLAIANFKKTIVS